MSNLIICISGDGGGSYGPSGVYHMLAESLDALNSKHWKVLPYETIPKNIYTNKDNICSYIEHNKSYYNRIYLIGWSLGTATAIEVTHELKNTIYAIIMLAPILHQCRMKNFLNINLPIGYIHGKHDVVAKYTNSQKLYDHTPNYRIIQINENADHLFSGCELWLNETIINMLYELDRSEKL